MSLRHDLALLSFDDASGRPRGWIGLGLSGAVIAELALGGHVTLQERRLTATDARPDDPLLAEMWQEMRSDARDRKARYWVHRFNKRRYGLTRRVARELESEGALAVQRRRILFVPVWRYPSLHTGREEALRERLAQAVSTEAAPDPTTACLGALVEAAQLRSVVFPRNKQARRVLRRWMRSSDIGREVDAVVQEVMAAVVAAIVASSVAGSTG